MQFFDLQTFSGLSIGEHSVAEMAKFAEQLGWSGICIADSWHGLERITQLKEHIAAAQKETKVEILPGITLHPSTPGELKHLLERVRGAVLVVAVAGGDYAINRAACEDNRVDILAHPERGRPDSGLDDICCRAAVANGVAIGVSFREVLYSSRRGRARVLQQISTNIQLATSMRAPLVFVSGAQSKWDMRDPRQLTALANTLGAELPTAFAAVSDIPNQMIVRNKKLLEGRVAGKGVEIVG